MIGTSLLKQLEHYLKDADEIWIAVALIKDDAFETLQGMIPGHAKQNFLIGIDLPTTPSVLRTLQGMQSAKLSAGIFKSDLTFHPKTYIIKKGEEIFAIIGSSNLTHGGLENNIEMNTIISDPAECRSLISWFQIMMKTAFPLSEENISEYEKHFANISEAEMKIKNVRQQIQLKPGPDANDPLREIDFSDRFFKKEDHLAFRTDLWRDESASANRERSAVSDRFLELHRIIYPKFREYDIKNIFCNVKNHIVSMYYHAPGQNKKLDAMWLSYGKSQREIAEYHKLFPKTGSDDENDLQSFINHARLQIRIELTEIGIWILFGKNNNGSLFDRQHFSQKMTDPVYRRKFYTEIKRLPKAYKITVNRVSKDVDEFRDPEELHQFCKTDRPVNYFIIGIDYKISDPVMSRDLLPVTVLTEFRRLFPIYDMMRDKRFSNE